MIHSPESIWMIAWMTSVIRSHGRGPILERFSDTGTFHESLAFVAEDVK